MLGRPRLSVAQPCLRHVAPHRFHYPDMPAYTYVLYRVASNPAPPDRWSSRFAFPSAWRRALGLGQAPWDLGKPPLYVLVRTVASRVARIISWPLALGSPALC